MNIRATPPPVRGLYLLTPDEADTGRLVQRVSALIGLGVTWLQYRNKSADAALRRAQALALLPVCAAAGVPLLVNDDWRLAADIGAAGAHLGEHDGELGQARRALGPTALLGASCYDSIALARRARDAGASHVAFGAFFPSTTKPGARHAPLALLAEARGLGLPTVAIGGITPDNARTVIAAGADLLAVLGAVFDAADPAARVRAFVSCFEPDPRPSPP
jgi:thiamine-phosphate pyrophosphorylase